MPEKRLHLPSSGEQGGGAPRARANELSVDELHARLLGALVRLRRRLRRRDGVEALVRWWWPAALVALVVQVVAWLRPVERAGLYSAVALGAGLASWAAWALARPLPLGRVALQADVEAGLKERLTTALELLHSGSPPAGMGRRQLHDALRAAEAAARDAGELFPLRWDRRFVALWAGLLFLTVALALLPNPQREVLAERRAMRELARQEAQRIERVRAELAQREGLLPSRERAELVRELAELAERLRQNPGDREQALADIERARRALQERLDPQAGSREAALARLAERLGQMSRDEPGNAAPQEAAEALQALAAQAATSSAQERAQVAAALRQEALRVAATDPEVAAALMALAEAVEAGDAEGARAAAQAGADALRAAEREVALQRDVARAAEALEEARAALAEGGGEMAAGRRGDAGGSGRRPAGQGRAGSGGQAGANAGAGGNPGGGGGTQADRLPPSTSPGNTGPMPRDGSGPGALEGAYEPRVFAPVERLRPGETDVIRGEAGAGGDERVREVGGAGAGLAGEALVPLSQAWPRYRSASAEALERTYIPAGLKAYVRDYFASLGE